MQDDARGDVDDDTLAVTEDNLAGCLGELSTPDKPSCFPNVLLCCSCSNAGRSELKMHHLPTSIGMNSKHLIVMMT